MRFGDQVRPKKDEFPKKDKTPDRKAKAAFRRVPRMKIKQEEFSGTEGAKSAGNRKRKENKKQRRLVPIPVALNNKWDKVDMSNTPDADTIMMSNDPANKFQAQLRNYKSYRKQRGKMYFRMYKEQISLRPSTQVGLLEAPHNQIFTSIDQLLTTLPVTKHDQVPRDEEGRFFVIPEDDYNKYFPEGPAGLIKEEFSHVMPGHRVMMVRQAAKEIIRIMKTCVEGDVNDGTDGFASVKKDGDAVGKAAMVQAEETGPVVFASQATMTSSSSSSSSTASQPAVTISSATSQKVNLTMKTKPMNKDSVQAMFDDNDDDDEKQLLPTPYNPTKEPDYLTNEEDTRRKDFVHKAKWVNGKFGKLASEAAKPADRPITLFDNSGQDPNPLNKTRDYHREIFSYSPSKDPLQSAFETKRRTGYYPTEAPYRHLLPKREEEAQYLPVKVMPKLNDRKEWPECVLNVYRYGKYAWNQDKDSIAVDEEYCKQFLSSSRDFVRPRGPPSEWNVDLTKMLDSEAKQVYPILIDGKRGCGKSCILNHLVYYARKSDYLVLFVNNGYDYIHRGDFIRPNSVYRDSFDSPPLIQQLLCNFLTVHRDKLEQLPISSQQVVEQYKELAAQFIQEVKRDRFSKGIDYGDGSPVAGDDEISYLKGPRDYSEMRNLADLVSFGSDSSVDAGSVMIEIIKELRNMTKYPVLIAVDDVNTWNFEFSDHYFRNEIDVEKSTFIRRIRPYQIGIIGALLGGVSTNRRWNDANTFKRGLIVGATTYHHPNTEKVVYDKVDEFYHETFKRLRKQRMSKNVIEVKEDLYEKKEGVVPLTFKLNNFSQTEFVSWVQRVKWTSGIEVLLPGFFNLNALRQLRMATQSNGRLLWKQLPYFLVDERDSDKDWLDEKVEGQSPESAAILMESLRKQRVR